VAQVRSISLSAQKPTRSQRHRRLKINDVVEVMRFSDIREQKENDSPGNSEFSDGLDLADDAFNYLNNSAIYNSPVRRLTRLSKQEKLPCLGSKKSVINNGCIKSPASGTPTKKLFSVKDLLLPVLSS